MIKAHQHQFAFVKLTHPEYLQSWFLGYSNHFKQFVGWSDYDGPSEYKKLESIEELRGLYRWFINTGYVLSTTYNDNINTYAC